MSSQFTDKQLDELAKKIVDKMVDRIAYVLDRLEAAINEKKKSKSAE